MGVLSYQLITEQTDHLQGESSAPHGPRAISSQPPPSHALPVYTHWSEPQLSPPRWVVPLPPYQDARVRGERVVNPHRACHIAGPSHPDSGLSTGGGRWVSVLILYATHYSASWQQSAQLPADGSGRNAKEACS